MPIEDVADTALWIAAYRAWETERPDAAFHDPFARRLAGERGEAMAQALRAREAMAFAMAIRTVSIDRLVLSAIAQGVDTVVNLGAGLDTRPYRLDLPAHLRWIEVDQPGVIAYKEELLAAEAPRCRLERRGLDLRERGFLDGLGGLVITEGLLGYLSNDEAWALAQDLSGFRYWIMDYSRGAMSRPARAEVKQVLAKAPIKLKVGDPFKFLAAAGWHVVEDRRILDEAERIGRPFPDWQPWKALLTYLPAIFRPLGNQAFGSAMFAK